jgi:hypothetical protein
MSTTFEHSRALAVCLGVALLASCTPDAPTATHDGRPELSGTPAVGTIAVCHVPDGGKILEVAEPALAGHLSHGDYITTLLVSHESGQPADGAHFGSIGEALAAARGGRLARGELVSAACRITIVVSAGAYQGTAGPASGGLEQFPLIVDVPDITLRGALEMGLDGADRATGDGTGGGETTLSPLEPLPVVAGASTPIVIANAHPGGSAGDGLTVEGFVFQSGHDPAVDAGGQGVLSVRTQRVTIRGNRFEGGFTESVDIRAGTGRVVENHLAGTAGTCDVCLAGPGSFEATGNRLLAGGIPGIVVSSPVGLAVPSGVEPFELPAPAETRAVIWNNEVRDHQRTPVGTGIRVDAIGVGAPNVHGTIHAIIRDNALVNNRFGMIVHAAFPVANTDRKGDVDVTLGGNKFQQSCQTNLLVSLSRHTTALGLTNNPYLLNSTFQLTLNGNVSWDDVWFSHPAGFGNTLVVDGQTIPNGGRQSYAPAGCPGLGS